MGFDDLLLSGNTIGFDDLLLNGNVYNFITDAGTEYIRNQYFSTQFYAAVKIKVLSIERIGPDSQAIPPEIGSVLVLPALIFAINFLFDTCGYFIVYENVST